MDISSIESSSQPITVFVDQDTIDSVKNSYNRILDASKPALIIGVNGGLAVAATYVTNSPAGAIITADQIIATELVEEVSIPVIRSVGHSSIDATAYSMNSSYQWSMG
ncbi:MAG: hypothetical protein K1000chlam3_01577 [Chlamydiae bacterium]|nr:hypothetical protein [Chlamydiota bacterium]